jgi:hypothetical protein
MILSPRLRRHLNIDFEELRKTMKHRTANVCRDSDPGSSEREVGVLTTTP